MQGFLLFLFLTFLFFKILKRIRKRSGLNPDKLKQKKVIRHGHRCFIDGLNSFETDVVFELSTQLSHKEFFIFNNLILPQKGGFTTQIDHVVVSKYGIFVIESKDLQGWVFGNKESKDWMQTFPNGSKFPFQNPLRQNYGHIAALKELMPFVKDSFHSVIVFSDKCEFKKSRIDNVLYLSELNAYIKNYQEAKIPPAELLMAIGKLSYMCQAVETTDSEHIENVKKMISYQKGEVPSPPLLKS